MTAGLVKEKRLDMEVMLEAVAELKGGTSVVSAGHYRGTKRIYKHPADDLQLALVA